MTTVRSRVHRILKAMERFESAASFEAEGKTLPVRLPAQEEFLGVYYNVENSYQQATLVTDQALYRLDESRIHRLSFDEMKSARSPSNVPKEVSKRDLRHLEVQMESGEVVILPVTGAQERTADVWEFMRFLIRVIGDRK